MHEVRVHRSDEEGRLGFELRRNQRLREELSTEDTMIAIAWTSADVAAGAAVVETEQLEQVFEGAVEHRTVNVDGRASIQEPSDSSGAHQQWSGFEEGGMSNLEGKIAIVTGAGTG